MRTSPTQIREQWTGVNGAAWSSQWGADDASAGSSTDIQSDQGRMRTGTTGSYSDAVSKPIVAMLPAAFELTLDLIVTDITESYPRLHFRDRDGFRGNSYVLQFEVAFNTVALKRFDNYSETILRSTGYTIGLNDVIHIRLRCDGPHLRVKTWSNASAEPGHWPIFATDWTHLGPTQRRLVLSLVGGPAASSRSCQWDNLDVRRLATGRHL